MLVTILSSLTIIQTYFDSVTSTMAQISVVVNKLKTPVFVSMGCGLISITVEIIMIKILGMGLYAIVLSTTIVMIIRYVVFNSVYAAWCLNLPRFYFFPTTLKTWLSIPGLIILMVLIRKIMPIHSWVDLCVDAGIAGVLGYFFMLILFGREEVFGLFGKMKGNIKNKIGDMP